MPALHRITVGLPDRKDIAPPSIEEMRKRIFEGGRDSNIIHSCMRTADMLGMNGEDRYTLLAYQALVQLERQYKLAMDLLACTPSATVFRADADALAPAPAAVEIAGRRCPFSSLAYDADCKLEAGHTGPHKDERGGVIK